MADQRPQSGIFARKASLVVAGLLAATASLNLLPTNAQNPASATSQNPIVANALIEARKHHSKGRYKQAASLLKEHATAKNPLALLSYGKLLARGWGIPKNLDKAREKLLMAVQHDFPKRGEAAFELGRVYRQSQGPDCDRIAFEWFIEAAKAGHVKAHAELGRHYARGIGVAIDLHAALKHYRIAARSGAANSLVSFVQRLSRLEDPQFAQVDLKGLILEAIPALESEAAGGRGSSAKVLGRLYRDGVHVEADMAMAQMWFERGTRLGDSGSMVELAQILQLVPDDAKSIERSLVLLERAAQLRNAGAITQLGRLHLAKRFGLKRDKARDLFVRGVKAGHAGSMLELARLHLMEGTTAKHQQEALKLLKRGAAKGHNGCRKLLAELQKAEVPTSAAYLAKIAEKIPAAKSAGASLKPIEPARAAKKVVPAMNKDTPSAVSTSATTIQTPSSPMTGATVNTRFGKRS